LTNREIADLLEQVGTALELVSDNPFKARAYYSAARTIAACQDSVYDLAEQGKATTIKGVGASVGEAINDIVKNGSPTILEELLGEIPPDVWRMLSLPGLGPKRVRSIWRSLSITTLDELEQACRDNRLLSLEGFGEKTQARILSGIDLLRRSEDRLLLSAAHQIADEFIALLAKRCELAGLSLDRVEVTGPLRRKCETVEVIDILIGSVNTEDSDRIAQVISGLTSDVEDVADAADLAFCTSMTGRSVAVAYRGARVAVHIRPASMFACSLFLLTGSSSHVSECIALFPGLLECDSALNSEATIYRSARMQFIPPEMREGAGEVAAAKAGKLPTLVEEGDIKGILHVHTNYSDGTHSIEDLVRYCIEQGYEYIGIADHSRSAFYAGGLSPSDLIRQNREIKEIQSKYPEIRILHGIESDIRADGSLDYDDGLLAMLDFVIGSIHSRFAMPKDQMTARVIAAVRNPYLSILGHPTGRLLLSRDPYEIDLDAVLEAVAEEGKSVELNADPHRLDLDYKGCLTARRMGIPVAINPDAHGPSGINNIRFGVSIARKGWLTKSDVLNCLTADEIVTAFRRMRKS